MLEALLLLTAAAVPPPPAPRPSTELLEFLAEWPDEGTQRLLDDARAEPPKQEKSHDKPDAKTR